MGFLAEPCCARRKRWRAVRIGATGFVAFLLAAFAWYASTGVLGENLHVVVPGKLYRSAQLSTERLDRLIADEGLACVLNLRKESPPVPAFEAEVALLAARGVWHENVKMSPTKLPKPDVVRALVQRFDVGPYPLLIHCKDGADRTGFATVLWLVVEGGVPLDTALADEFNWRKGHFSFGQTRALDEFFELFRTTSHGQSLREWILGTYPDVHALRTGTRSSSADVLAHDR